MKMAKKRIGQLLGLILATVMLAGLCGCSGKEVVLSPENITELEAKTYQIASGSSTGGYYLQITPIAALWEQYDFVEKCAVQATSGALENSVMISTGVAEAGLVDSFAYFAAAEGTEPYKEKYGGLSAIAAGAPSLTTVVVRADSDIYSIGDLEGHSIAVGLAGSGAEFEERFILETLGLSYGKFSKVDMIGIGPGFSSFQDGKTDAVIALMGTGNSSLREAMTNVNIRLISFSEEEIQKITETYQFAVPDVIPAGSYDGIDEDIRTVSVPCILAVSDDLSDEEVYYMTKKTHENVETLKAANKNFDKWEFGIASTGAIPLHPGAKAYYEEIGLE